MSSSTMGSLARSFTKRTKRNATPAAQDAPMRSGSVRYAAGTVNRALISLPTELISTTNVNALNYPDISSLSNASSNSSINSGNDSDFSHMSTSFIDSPATTPGAYSVESSPIASEPRKTSNNFFDIMKRSTSSAGNRPSTPSSIVVPVIPQRALSHSKKAHQHLAHKRSLQRLTPPPLILDGPTIVRNSVDMFNGAADADHPFGKELAQVNEVAEEFGLVSPSLQQEEQYLTSQGLMKFAVEDYINEIQGMYGGVYEGRLGPMANPWM